jgi:mycothiol system anti-sigma-R factor
MTDGKRPKGDEDIGCLESIEALYAYLDGEIRDPQALAAIEHHLGHCRSCFSRMELERNLTARARQSTRSQAPASLQERLRNLLEKI